uniref:PD-(D/E)XK nuclease-like domain-containing protein n=1 Tax=Pyricularia oryzae (strain 70-15 / ATCC MYA-4617 / FGSC 8958) TaxID=242507 RepID=Q2KHI2_PYRO7|nr:hypothetical protein MGCH7_ch7g3 [Pyricularia oryzae 70-15]
MPPSPPASSKRASSPSKRRRPDDKVPIDVDFDITPRPSRHLAFDIGLSLQQTPSRSRPSKRSLIPIKFTDELAMLEKPIRIKKPSLELLPTKAQELYSSVLRMVDFAIAIVPIEAERAFGEHVRMAELPPTIFKGQKDEGLSEFSWNIEVHAPLLKLATRKTPGVSRYEIISARVSNLCLPPFGDGATCEFPESYVAPPSSVSSKSTSSTAASRKKDNHVAAGRMVDFGLFMETKSTPLEKAISALVLQSEQRSVNHSSYSPLRSLPLGVSIETKSPGAADNGLVQLALWTAAWFRRMEQLLELLTYRQTEFQMLEAVPAVLVNGHQWRLLFFCHRGDSITCVGEIPMGDTTTLTGAYKVLGVLRLLVRWVDEDLREWFEGLLLRA